MRIKQLLNSFRRQFHALLLGLFLALGLGGLVTVPTGCANTPRQIAYKSLKSVQDGSLVALEYYRVQFKAGKVDEVTRARVQTLYSQYQAAFALAATAARLDYNAPATPELIGLANNLIAVIQSLK